MKYMSQSKEIKQNCIAQKMKCSIKDFFSKCDQITFTEEIFNGKFHFLCSLGQDQCF